MVEKEIILSKFNELKKATDYVSDLEVKISDKELKFFENTDEIDTIEFLNQFYEKYGKIIKFYYKKKTFKAINTIKIIVVVFTILSVFGAIIMGIASTF
ncbi:MAG: hypothetical protein LBP67_05240 [Bacteroidales bacterium]|jgi:hypothetical protein|nr:hypothetical protein [Bacteroidales bacterium]